MHTHQVDGGIISILGKKPEGKEKEKVPEVKKEVKKEEKEEEKKEDRKHSAPIAPEVKLREKVIRKNISASDVSDGQEKVSTRKLDIASCTCWNLSL